LKYSAGTPISGAGAVSYLRFTPYLVGGPIDRLSPGIAAIALKLVCHISEVVRGGVAVY